MGMKHPPRLYLGSSGCSAPWLVPGRALGTRLRRRKLLRSPRLTPLTERFHESSAFMEIRPSVLPPAVSCALCWLQGWFNLPGLSGHFNHREVLNKEPRVPLGKSTQKRILGNSWRASGKGQTWSRIYGRRGCNQVAARPQWLPTPFCLLMSGFGGCFCRFLLKITPAPPWRVMEAVAGAG